MHELLPKATRFAVLVNPANATITQATSKALKEAARALGTFFDADKCAASFYDLVGKREQRRRDVDAKPDGGLAIDHEFEFDGLLHRQVRAVDILGRAAKISMESGPWDISAPSRTN